ncbi:DMT family transporter [Sphingobacterium sp. MYb382]|uniref:DMT family transporter n=1 Tax=Sphingobacterium sp. MYb382 TaxID=2745278 RepID=UPI00309A18CF
MNKFKGLIAVFLGAASFGILSTFVKKAYGEGFNLGEVTGVQALFGMVFLWVLLGIVVLFNKGYLKKYPATTPTWKMILSGTATGAVSILYYKSVSLVPASLAIVLLMQYIWIGQLIEFVVFKERPSKKTLIGIAVILASTLLATGLLEKEIQDISLLGIFYGLAAATAYATIIIVNGRVGNDYAPLHKGALMVTGAVILVFVLLQPFSIFQSGMDSLWNYGLLLAFFGTVLPPVLFAYGMPKTGVSLGSILSAVELPVAVCMAYFVLHEYVSPLQFFGVVLILAVVVYINTQTKKD